MIGWPMAIMAVLLAPFVGGLLMGFDRQITARLQSRVGPPLLQPFYDVGKLLGKRAAACNTVQNVCVSLYLAATALSLMMLALGQDLLVLLFVFALASIMLVLGAFSTKSPYSQLGAHREVLQMLAYEPLLVLMVVGIYMQTGSFSGARAISHPVPLLLTLPVFLLTQTMVLAIRLHKSPFDLSASHHAHQELVRGIYTEFSGPQLAVIGITHFYEVVLLLAFIGMMWQTNAIIGSLIAVFAYFAVIVLDNVTVRMTWSWLLRFAWSAGLGLAVANLLVLRLAGPVVH